MMPLWTTTISPGAVAVRDARSPRSAGRASPSGCGRCRTSPVERVPSR